MSDQLVLYINRAADHYRWCWLDAAQQPLAGSSGEGSSEQLAEALQGGSHQAWLIVPGTKVVTRTLEYSEKEKKHLRSLLPFQLEETVVGDVDRFHFALGPLNKGTTCIAYIEKAWLQQVFAQLAELGIEVIRCWSAPLTLPLATEPAEEDAPAEDHWTLQVQDRVLLVRHASHLGFSVDLPHARLALELLLTNRKQVDTLPLIDLRGNSEADLDAAADILPTALHAQVASRTLVDPWVLDYAAPGIDLCQGEFSQRLPIERWWRYWQHVAVFAGICLAIHLGIQGYQIREFRQENLAIRQEMQAVYRRAVPQGAIVDPERQLAGLVRELQPSGQGGSLVRLLSQVMPPLADSGVNLRSVQYTGDAGEINMQLQAQEFNAIQNLASQIEQQGLRAELLGASASGNTHSARLKISANP